MSAVTTTPLHVAPDGADMPALTQGASTWAFGAWVELIAATTGATSIAGLVVGFATYSEAQLEVQIGVGAALGEVPIGLIRLQAPNSGAGPDAVFMLRVPLSGIASGVRVSLRLRAKSAGLTSTLPCGLLYYTSLDSDLSLPTSLSCAPLGADSVIITPSATPWTSSAWVSLTTGFADATILMGIAIENPVSNVDLEWDLGTGASPSVVSTLRSSVDTKDLGRLWYVMLPALLPLAAATPVSIRLRSSGTSTLGHVAALLYWPGSATPPPPPVVTQQVLRRVRRFPFPASGNKMMFLSRVEFLIQAGEGLTPGPASDPPVLGSDPIIMFRLSRDGGQTWGQELQMGIGRQGAYTYRAYLNRLGRGRNLVGEVSCTDPIPLAFLDCVADMEPGTS